MHAPVAPASIRASAWTRPSPLPPPDTTMTLFCRLNSGRRVLLVKWSLRRANELENDLAGGRVLGLLLPELEKEGVLREDLS